MFILCWIFFIFLEFEKYSIASVESDFTIPDYDYYWTTEKPDLGKSLSLKISTKKKNDAIFRTLQKQIANDTEYFEDIPHFEINSTWKIKQRADMFEKEFKRIIGMVGYQYTYQRDMHWRTWREVSYSNETKEVFCYRCNNMINGNRTNGTDCHFGGYWILEDQPPTCSYEILSFKRDNQLCVANYWQFRNENLASCPFTIAYHELSLCEIPFLTRLRVSPDYSSQVSERESNVICKARQECEFSTLYNITYNIVAFRIINSSNDIIYSRLMKRNGTVYVCVEECGKIDLSTMKTQKTDKHVILNMLVSRNNKKKRENRRTNGLETNLFTRDKNNVHMNVESNLNHLKRNLFARRRKYILEKPLRALVSPKTTTVSVCRQMALRQTTDYDKYWVY